MVVLPAGGWTGDCTSLGMVSGWAGGVSVPLGAAALAEGSL
jgi:hypothetical protein